MTLSLCACAKTGEPGTTGGNAETTGNNGGTSQAPAATKTVLCLTKIVSSDDGEEYVYNVTYEENGVHVTPETLGYRVDTVYDADGKVLSELTYNDEGINTYRDTYTYNNAGQKIEELFWDVEDDRLLSRNVYSYNDQGQLVKREITYGSNLTGRTEFIYDANGFLTEEHHYNNDGVMTARGEYTTNSEGQIQSYKEYIQKSSDKSLSEYGTYTYSYNSEGRLISRVWENTTPYYSSEISDYFTYDQKGNVIRSDTQDVQKTYSYNEDGYLVSFAYEGDSTNALVYAEMELTETQAEMAQKWSKDGVKNAFVDTLDD